MGELMTPWNKGKEKQWHFGKKIKIVTKCYCFFGWY